MRDIGGENKSVDTDQAFNSELNKTVSSMKKECKKRNILLLEPEKFEKAGTKEKKLRTLRMDIYRPEHLFIMILIGEMKLSTNFRKETDIRFNY